MTGIKILPIQWPIEDYLRLRQAAKTRDITMSALVRKATARFLNDLAEKEVGDEKNGGEQ